MTHPLPDAAAPHVWRWLTASQGHPSGGSTSCPLKQSCPPRCTPNPRPATNDTPRPSLASLCMPDTGPPTVPSLVDHAKLLLSLSFTCSLPRLPLSFHLPSALVSIPLPQPIFSRLPCNLASPSCLLNPVRGHTTRESVFRDQLLWDNHAVAASKERPCCKAVGGVASCAALPTTGGGPSTRGAASIVMFTLATIGAP